MPEAVDEDRAASAFRRPSRLALKIGLLLVLPFLGAIAATTLFGLYLARTESLPAQLNFTGRQRMLAMQLGDRGAMVAAGQEAERGRLGELIATFDRTFAALTAGGTLDGKAIRPLPAELGEPGLQLGRRDTRMDRQVAQRPDVAHHPLDGGGSQLTNLCDGRVKGGARRGAVGCCRGRRHRRSSRYGKARLQASVSPLSKPSRKR